MRGCVWMWAALLWAALIAFIGNLSLPWRLIHTSGETVFSDARGFSAKQIAHFHCDAPVNFKYIKAVLYDMAGHMVIWSFCKAS